MTRFIGLPLALAVVAAFVVGLTAAVQGHMRVFGINFFYRTSFTLESLVNGKVRASAPIHHLLKRDIGG